MLIASAAAYGLGQLLGLGILVLVGVGIVKTLTRSVVSTREKILGKRRAR